ncbi:hypothetical protein AWW66_24150 [Micromonospora rosaria]|uniref:Uncharacterized protein n=1 Tax=Micromonospora rosaria TaxID=47874 RepID=A0A136PM18_9ACTN|nr:hypothetical protein [Micromonospora rosaria]KXK59441.1 hypothetical protein AWW66_24150 [Micromonospora rosaria]
MGEQATTGAGGSPAPEEMPDAGGDDAAAATGSGAAPPGGPAAPEGSADAIGPSRSTDIVPGPGGVMTDEVGVVTGELTLRTEYADGRVTVRVQYKDADEWYAVTGGSAPLADPAALDAVHAVAVGLLDRPEG